MDQLRRLLWKWLGQLVLVVSLMTGLLAAAHFVEAHAADWWPELAAWPIVSGAAFWMVALLLSLPLLVAAGGKITAGTILFAEHRHREHSIAAARQLWWAGMTALGTWACSALVVLQPPWQVVPVLPLFLIGVAYDRRRVLRTYYTR